MRIQLIDSHVHLNFDVFQQDIEEVRKRWREAGVVRLVHSCVEPSEFPEIKALSQRFPEIAFAVGLHPLDAEKWTDKTAQEILSLASREPQVVAIGEMGLDFYKAENYQRQELVFEEQLEIAKQLNKPVIIHCRDAAPSLRKILAKHQQQGNSLRGVMHCWTGTPEETQWFLELGFYISFSGVVTFKNAQQVQTAAAIVPPERLLVETDCPFLSPVPKRGKRNEPSHVLYVAEYLAQLRQVPLENLAAETTTNACQLFGLNVPQSQLVPQ